MRSAASRVSGKLARRPTDVTAPSRPIRRRSSSRVKASSSRRHQAPRLVRCLDPHEARFEAGERHRRHRPGGTMELAGDVVVRAGVTKPRRHRGLRIGARARLDAGFRAAERAATIGADDQPRREPLAVAEAHARCVVREREARLDRALDQSQVRLRRRRRQQRDVQRGVVDVHAEGGEAQLGRAEQHLRRAPQAAGVVDQADARHRHQRRAEPRAKPEAIEHRDAAGEQRCRARVAGSERWDRATARRRSSRSRPAPSPARQ